MLLLIPLSTNPFIAKVVTSSPRKAHADENVAALREGMGRMDIASRNSSGEFRVPERRESKDTTNKGRDVGIDLIWCLSRLISVAGQIRPL